MIVPKTMTAYLKATDIINWQHPAVLDLAKNLAVGHKNQTEIAKTCFQWVRDQIRHSYDYQLNPFTYRASDVLQHNTGYCYAKSHLLAALLRANGIPAELCYQRLSVNEDGAPYCLHGLNAVYLLEFGWYRIDARGNREGVNAKFTPPHEQLAFNLQFSAEASFSAILTDPLDIVVEAMQEYTTWDRLLNHLPDISPEAAIAHGLFNR